MHVYSVPSYVSSDTSTGSGGSMSSALRCLQLTCGSASGLFRGVYF